MNLDFTVRVEIGLSPALAELLGKVLAPALASVAEEIAALRLERAYRDRAERRREAEARRAVPVPAAEIAPEPTAAEHPPVSPDHPDHPDRPEPPRPLPPRAWAPTPPAKQVPFRLRPGWLTPLREDVLQRMYPAGDALADIKTAMAGLPGPTMPQNFKITVEANRLGLRRPPAAAPQGTTEAPPSVQPTQDLERQDDPDDDEQETAEESPHRGMSPSAPVAPAESASLELPSDDETPPEPAGERVPGGARGDLNLTMEIIPADEPEPEAAAPAVAPEPPATQWSDERLLALEIGYERGDTLQDLFARLNAMPGKPIGAPVEVRHKAEDEGFERPKPKPSAFVPPKPPPGVAIVADWGQIEQWGAERGLPFRKVGDLVAVNAKRAALGLPEFELRMGRGSRFGGAA